MILRIVISSNIVTLIGNFEESISNQDASNDYLNRTPVPSSLKKETKERFSPLRIGKFLIPAFDKEHESYFNYKPNQGLEDSIAFESVSQSICTDLECWNNMHENLGAQDRRYQKKRKND
jgi:hypothetical protein